MDMGTFRGVVTVLLMAAFIGLWIWAWSNKRRSDFEAAARLPLDDELEESGTARAKRQGADDE